MKIRILNSGEERHIDTSTGNALISAGLALDITKSKVEELRSQPRPNSKAQFRVMVHHASGALTIQRRQLNCEGYFFGPSALAKQNFPDCPDEIIAEYKSQRERNPSLADEIIRAANTKTRDWRP